MLLLPFKAAMEVLNYPPYSFFKNRREQCTFVYWSLVHRKYSWMELHYQFMLMVWVIVDNIHECVGVMFVVRFHAVSDGPLRALMLQVSTLLSIIPGGPFYWWRLPKMREWISNYNNVFVWDVITPPCPNFNGSLAKLPLKLWHGWVITSHSFV